MMTGIFCYTEGSSTSLSKCSLLLLLLLSSSSSSSSSSSLPSSSLSLLFNPFGYSLSTLIKIKKYP
jgi:hypothetical protein